MIAHLLGTVASSVLLGSTSVLAEAYRAYIVVGQTPTQLSASALRAYIIVRP